MSRTARCNEYRAKPATSKEHFDLEREVMRNLRDDKHVDTKVVVLLGSDGEGEASASEQLRERVERRLQHIMRSEPCQLKLSAVSPATTKETVHNEMQMSL